jgi:hypothetical protein
MKSAIPVDGTVFIAGDVHCKSQEALDNVLKWLSEDYDVKDCSKDEQHPHEGFYARLKESVCQSCVKCDYCGFYSTKPGITSISSLTKGMGDPNGVLTATKPKEAW